MNEQNKIFEIREYLDDYGKISDHELLDVTRELEYMEKLYSQNDSSNSNTSINVNLECKIDQYLYVVIALIIYDILYRKMMISYENYRQFLKEILRL